jgi:hypothetical protein
MHPTLREALIGLARVGSKAVASGLDSVLEDVEGAFNEGVTRLKNARKKAQSIGRDPPVPRSRYTGVDVIDTEEEE